MNNRFLFVSVVTLALAACAPSPSVTPEPSANGASSSVVVIQKTDSSKPVTDLTDAEWKARLTAEQYYILRQEGTETPFTSPLNDEHRRGVFLAADTMEPLFHSDQKYDSGTGWPSFWAPISPDAIQTRTDITLGIERTEVLSTAGGHLGHVFEDGPEPTGLRYCMNGDALIFVPQEEWDAMQKNK